ncbi:MAG: NAD-dependent succinate-semialdehyde dehydrogenase [Bdellovibrionota bacterium]
MKSINPFNLEVLEEFKEITSTDLEKTLAHTDKAFQTWKRASYQDRGALFQKLSTVLKTKSDSLAKMMTKEMGKRFSDAKAEIMKCAEACDHYAKHTEEFLKDQPVSTDGSQSFITFQPLGTILAIMPWNFPFWQVFRFAVPTLMAGNVGILKHASNVSQCAVEIERLFIEAGFPNNILSTVLLGSDKVAKLIADPRIKAVTLTGSTPAGKSVAENAGKNLKKCVLELGGSDAYVVLDDADLKAAIEICAKSRLINSGQSCISAKRFVVTSKVYEQFKEGLIEKFKSLRMGDPLDDNTTLAPLARTDLRDDLHKQVRKALEHGARLVYGGEIPHQEGAFYSPTILENINSENPAYYEEFFGPVALLFKAKNEKEALAIANDSHFGLGAAVFTANTNHGVEIAKKELEAGSCFVNALVKSDSRLPFGGIKTSGFGRELSHFGIHEFVNIKTVYVK